MVQAWHQRQALYNSNAAFRRQADPTNPRRLTAFCVIDDNVPADHMPLAAQPGLLGNSRYGRN